MSDLNVFDCPRDHVLRIPIRGYELGVYKGDKTPRKLRIPIRGYELSKLISDYPEYAVTNPYKGL